MHGIVIVEIYSYTKRINTLYTVVMSFSYILPKCVKTRKTKDEHCISWCTQISYNIHDPIPMDNLKTHTALPYITWGLILGPKNKRKESLRLQFSPDMCPEFQS